MENENKTGKGLLLWLLEMLGLRDKEEKADKPRNRRRTQRHNGDTLKARWLRFKELFKARRLRVKKRLSALGSLTKKATGLFRPIAKSKLAQKAAKLLAPAARFAERFGLRTAAKFGLRAAIGLGIGVLALTPIGWSMAGLVIGTAAAIGATMLVDFAFDAVGKRFGGKAKSLLQAVKMTASEWRDVAVKNVNDFKSHILKRDTKAVRSDLVRLGYNAADEYSGHLITACDGSFKSAAKWFVGSNLGMVKTGTTIAFTLAEEAITHPKQAFQIAKDVTSGFRQIISLSANATEAILEKPDLRSDAEIVVGVVAAIKTAEYGMHIAASPVRGAGSFGRAALYGGAMVGITYEVLKHPKETFEILGKAGHAADAVTETIWNHPDLRDLVITGGVAGAARYVSNRRPVERLKQRLEL